MQCLLSIPELNFYFSNSLYKKDKIKSTKSKSCDAFSEFIDLYFNNTDTSLKPNNSLYKVCHSFLEAGQQHDCQEYLRRYLTSIQEEICGTKKYTIPDKIKCKQAWDIYKENNFSIIDSLFSGLMRSSVTCNKCGAKSGKALYLS